MPPKKKKRATQTLEERMELRMSAVEKRTFQEAADKQGISLSLWLRLAAWQTINSNGGRVQLLDLSR